MGMRVEASSTLGGLVDDLKHIPRMAAKESAKVVRTNTVEGKKLAQQNARRTARRHGKLYPRSFTQETSAYVGGFGASFTGIYGPDSSRPQGGMSFEGGSRNQKPHLDLAKSADVIGPKFASDVAGIPDQLFWPAG